MRPNHLTPVRRVVKEHVGLFKAASNYDVYDADGGALIFECREEKLGFFTKMLRFTDYKRMTPFNWPPQAN